MPLSSVSANSKPPIYKRKWFIVVAVLLVLGMIGGCSGGGKTKGSDSASSQVADSQGNIELKATTEYLEYSNKNVDPTTLVKVDNSKVRVSTKD